jgi:hypothetical protein
MSVPVDPRPDLAGPDTCCPSTLLASCCRPEDKAACCGTSTADGAPSGCGCQTAA